MEPSQGEVRAVRRAFKVLGGEQSIDAIRDWVKLQAPEHYDYRRIGTIIRGHSDLEKARERHPNFNEPFLKRTKKGHYKLLEPNDS